MNFKIGEKVVYKSSIEYVITEAHVSTEGYWYIINPIDNPNLPMNLVVDEDQIRPYTELKSLLRNNALDKLLND